MNKDNFVIETVDKETEKKLLGIRGWFLRGEKRQAVLTSKLVKKAIKDHKKAGGSLSRKEIDKIKFAHDPIFRQEVIDKVHRDCDKEYRQNIKKCENKIKSLEEDRIDEIERIKDARWEEIVDDGVQYNMTEGKLLYGDEIFLFSDIRGAAVSFDASYRAVPEENNKSKKNATVDTAALSGLCFGTITPVVGGITAPNNDSVANTIPTANHLGVMVDIQGERSEIVLLNETTDQDSRDCRKAVQKAETLVTKLHFLSATPVPANYLQPEEEKSVLKIDDKIVEAKKDLEAAKADVPTYDIPERYL